MHQFDDTTQEILLPRYLKSGGSDRPKEVRGYFDDEIVEEEPFCRFSALFSFSDFPGFFAESFFGDLFAIIGSFGLMKKIPVTKQHQLLSDGDEDLKLDRTNLTRLLALLTLRDLKLDTLALGKIAISIHLDLGVMYKDILTTAVWGDESKTLFCVKPFHGSN